MYEEKSSLTIKLHTNICLEAYMWVLAVLAHVWVLVRLAHVPCLCLKPRIDAPRCGLTQATLPSLSHIPHP